MQSPVTRTNESSTTRVIRLVPEQPVRRIPRPPLSVVTADSDSTSNPASPPSAA